jgi:hypothetical protein
MYLASRVARGLPGEREEAEWPFDDKHTRNQHLQQNYLLLKQSARAALVNFDKPRAIIFSQTVNYCL